MEKNGENIVDSKIDIGKDVLYENIKLINTLSYRVGRLTGALEMLLLDIKLNGVNLDVSAYEKMLVEGILEA